MVCGTEGGYCDTGLLTVIYSIMTFSARVQMVAIDRQDAECGVLSGTLVEVGGVCSVGMRSVLPVASWENASPMLAYEFPSRLCSP